MTDDALNSVIIAREQTVQINDKRRRVLTIKVLVF